MITHEQWLDAIRQAEEVVADGALTTAEWSEKMSAGDRKTRKWIRSGLENGWMVCVYVRRPSIIGAELPVPAYKIIEEKKP